MTVAMSLLAQILHIGLMIPAAPTAAGAMDLARREIDRTRRPADPSALARSGPPVTQDSAADRECLRRVALRTRGRLRRHIVSRGSGTVLHLGHGVVAVSRHAGYRFTADRRARCHRSGCNGFGHRAPWPDRARRKRARGPGRTGSDARDDRAGADGRQLQPRPRYRATTRGRPICRQPPRRSC